jgi:hypothetical protein
MALFGGEFSEICDVAIGTDQEVSWVIRIKIHYNIGANTSVHNETFLITQRWNSAEWALHIISIEWAVFTTQILKSVWGP